MKKVLISVLVLVIVVIFCLFINELFFSKTVPTGDQNGEFPTVYSSKDMLGNWDISIMKQTNNLTIKSSGTMNITSLNGIYFYGTIAISESNINNKTIKGGIVNIEGSVYNDIVTVYFNHNEEYLNINYNAKLNPEISNNYMVLNLNDDVKEENENYKYIFNLIKKEEYNNER